MAGERNRHTAKISTYMVFDYFNYINSHEIGDDDTTLVIVLDGIIIDDVVVDTKWNYSICYALS